MRILYIIPTFQHPKVRGSLRHYHFIRALAERHTITLLTLVRSPIAPEAMAEMAGYTERIFTFPVNSPSANGKGQGATLHNLVKQVPMVGRQAAQQLALQESVAQMKAKFQELLQNEAFDVVLFHGKDCFPVIADYKEQANAPLVIDFCDATSLRIRTKMRHVNPLMAALLGLRYRQVRQVERKMVRGTRQLAFISERDRAAVLGSQSQATVIPNGIDLAYWTRRTHRPEPNCLIFTGVMDYGPNNDAALYLIDRILPHLRPHVADLKVIIAGRNPTAALQERAQRHSDVIVTGFVDDMRDALEQATVFAAPLRFGAGMQNKLQEALAMEIPVVTSSLGGNGMRVTDGEEPPLVIADEDEIFAKKVLYLLNNPAERRRLAQAGRHYAQQHFDWSRSVQQLEDLCLAACTQKQPLSTGDGSREGALALPKPERARVAQAPKTATGLDPTTKAVTGNER
ncbi:MAG: glycosyltransferase [Caldilineaceae bacterium]|nr:glycosyltransferase [Caldilineaceae bacterium]